MKNLFLYISVILFFSNVSLAMSPQNSESKKEDSISIEGNLNGSNVSNIKIDDLQEAIPFYLIPKDSAKNPRDDFKYFSLIPHSTKEYVKSVKLLKNLDGKDEIEKFYNNQSYVEVIVTQVYNGVEETGIFLLSSNSVISSVEKVEGSDFMRSQRKTKVAALQNLEITGISKCRC